LHAIEKNKSTEVEINQKPFLCVWEREYY